VVGDLNSTNHLHFLNPFSTPWKVEADVSYRKVTRSTDALKPSGNSFVMCWSSCFFKADFVRVRFFKNSFALRTQSWTESFSNLLFVSYLLSRFACALTFLDKGEVRFHIVSKTHFGIYCFVDGECFVVENTKNRLNQNKRFFYKSANFKIPEMANYLVIVCNWSNIKRPIAYWALWQNNKLVSNQTRFQTDQLLKH